MKERHRLKLSAFIVVFSKILEMGDETGWELRTEQLDEAEKYLADMTAALKELEYELLEEKLFGDALLELGEEDAPTEPEKIYSFILSLTAWKATFSFALVVARQLRFAIDESDRYKKGIVHLPTGQRIFSALDYLQHDIRQLRGRVDSLDTAEKQVSRLNALVISSGSALHLGLKKAHGDLEKLRLALKSTIHKFESGAVDKKRTFAESKAAAPSIIPCMMKTPGMATERIQCIALYRGLHFRKDYFDEIDVERQARASLDQIPAYSEQARKNADVAPGLVEQHALARMLEEEAAIIAEKLLAVRDKEVEQHWNKGHEASQYYSLLQRYVNSYGKFCSELKLTQEIPPIYQGLGFDQMPFVSFSFNPIHSIRYAMGMRNPKEDSHLRRRQDRLGELYIYLVPLTPDNVERLNNILYLHNQEALSIKVRYLSAVELTVLGGLSSACLVGRMIIGHNGATFFDRQETELPAGEEARQKRWEKELAARAIACASLEARELKWDIVGYEFLNVSRNDFKKPYLEKAKDILGMNTRFSSTAGDIGRLSNADVSSLRDTDSSDDKGKGKEKEDGTKVKRSRHLAEQLSREIERYFTIEQIKMLEVPRSIDDYLKQQNIRTRQATLRALLRRFREGRATPDGNNCLIHTLYQLHTQDPDTVQDFDTIRDKYGFIQGEMLSATDGHQLAKDLDLHAALYAIGHAGRIEYIGEIGTATGRKCSILHFGAHYIPLWPRLS